MRDPGVRQQGDVALGQLEAGAEDGLGCRRGGCDALSLRHCACFPWNNGAAESQAGKTTI